MGIQINGNLDTISSSDNTWAIVDKNGSKGTANQVLTAGTSGLELLWQDASSVASASFPSGTVMLFQQSSSPTGWTKITIHNDKALRVVSGAVSSGGITAFSSVFNGSVGNTTLTTSQMPNHTHTADSASGTNFGSFFGRTIGTSPFATLTTNSTGGGGSHTHTIDVQYVDVIFASKD